MTFFFELSFYYPFYQSYDKDIKFQNKILKEYYYGRKKGTPDV